MKEPYDDGSVHDDQVLGVLANVVDWIRRTRTTGDAEISAETGLISEKVLDSMDFLQLVSFLEDTFDVNIDPDLMVPENFETPTAVARLVSRVGGGHEVARS